jgi:hypothetical protein
MEANFNGMAVRDRISKRDIKKHEMCCGSESALNLLTLYGPELYDGDDYVELLEGLKKRITATP